MGRLGGLMSMCFLFSFFSFFWGGEEWDSSYHDGGRVVGISLERERVSQSQYTKYHARQKKKKKTNSTFQTMHNNIHLPLYQQPLQLLRPNPFRIKFQKRLDLIFIGHGTNHLQLVLWSRRSCFQLRDYHFCLGNCKLGFSCADGDDFLIVVGRLEAVFCWRKDGFWIRHGGRGGGMWRRRYFRLMRMWIIVRKKGWRMSKLGLFIKKNDG